MLYHSTNNPAHRVDLKEAILRSLPPDNGLYMPDTLPVLDPTFWENWRNLSFQESGLAVATAFFGEDVPPEALLEIVNGTVSFDAPLVRLGPGEHRLAAVQLTSYRTPMDLVILPPESSIWESAENISFPVPLHPMMLTSQRVLDDVEKRLLK